MLHYFVQLNFASVMILFCLLIFLNTNNIFDRKIVRMFSIASVMVLVLIIVDSVEAWCATLSHPMVLRIWMSAIGYSVRPVIIFMVIVFLKKGDWKHKYWWMLPLIINTIVCFSALFTDITFTYDANNQFIRGPLGICPFVTSGIYLVFLMVSSIRFYKNGSRMESMITIVMTVFTTVSVFLESVLHYDGMINTAGSILIVFYYLYFVTQRFKRDPLTDAFNRRSFYSDAESREKEITAVVSLDLNNLKEINDHGGHDQGDIAIQTLAKVAQKELLSDCYLYRTGGDEFMILCFQEKRSDITAMIERIRASLGKTIYQCAIGVAYTNEYDNFDTICKIADRAMYANKKLLKNGGTIR